MFHQTSNVSPDIKDKEDIFENELKNNYCVNSVMLKVLNKMLCVITYKYAKCT